MESKQLKLWFLIPLIVFIGFIIMLFFRLGKPTEIVTNTALERPVPTFELPLLSDTSLMVTDSQMPTSPYLINIWGSWCPTCVYEHPFFLELKKRGVHTVGVNYKDEIGDALNYLNELGDPYLMSVQDYSGQFALDLGLTGAPETFVVDSKGIIRQHIVGEVNEENWQSRINPCLKLLQQEATGEKIASTQVEEVCQ
ncbi:MULTISPECIES: DsbE family thiol:disulfide interchange protein [Psychrobacter]|jgi:cytochrome c biogenesis protein CcmG/thiol:disulfide interchange protein DsbE|uniref:DsbE family thiol:disulfide interchange protein n=1 Tax=Psychrobacter TaxID=497 RepID=UPI000B7E0C50|nr:MULTISPECIES: DsbE family thiol:disulfide interchange protein [Psychrobacter]MCG3861774.1 DsbE family thiol:disulfide interchange protein [Psychrobacter sp. Ps5]MDN3397202.1 DsbE family thiol:disulfide interchange protein [Psychrobacter sp. APC 3426]MDX1787240.1 DsbE family thiol:disulfide interchange protein [Psychrobacter sp.]OXL28866.1 thiol:disulfide interchange protein [Psychrobacter sp. DAB_AL32B]